VVERLGRRKFALDEVYAFDSELKALHPKMRMSGQKFVNSYRSCAILAKCASWSQAATNLSRS
jgi:hypothetical protein